MGQHQADEKRLLLAGRGACGGRVLRPVPDVEIADMGPDQRASGGGVAAAIVAQQRAVAILRLQRRAARRQRLDLALEARASRRKWRGVVALPGDEGLKPAYAFEAGGRDRDAEFGRLALDRVQPGGLRPPSSSSRLRPRRARSNCPTRAPWPGSMASTKRSRNGAARSPGRRTDCPSPASARRGAASRRTNARTRPGSRSIRWRRSAPSPAVPGLQAEPS